MRTRQRPQHLTYTGNGFDDPGDPEVDDEQWNADQLAEAGCYDEWLREP